MKTILKVALGVFLGLWVFALVLHYFNNRPPRPKPVPLQSPTATPQGTTPSAKPQASPPPATAIRYRRGKKGGCYYVNERGKKVYVDASMCR